MGIRLTAGLSEQITNRQIIRIYMREHFAPPHERWETDLFADYTKEFALMFGPRLHTVMDSSRRRLSVWYVDDWAAPFWAISHRDRGTSYEVLRTATDEQCLDIFVTMRDRLRALALAAE